MFFTEQFECFAGVDDEDVAVIVEGEQVLVAGDNQVRHARDRTGQHMVVVRVVFNDGWNLLWVNAEREGLVQIHHCHNGHALGGNMRRQVRPPQP